ncbi:MAG: nuclear transport factor 2 family protein [Anaerolineae bacterium]
MLEKVETNIAEAFVAAVVDRSLLGQVVTDDVGMRVHGAEENAVMRPLDRVRAYIEEAWPAEPDLRAEVLSSLGNGELVSLEFRVQYHLAGRYVEDNCAAFLQVRDGRAHTIDLYRTALWPSAHRGEWIAPATLTDDEIAHLFEEAFYSWDPRDRISPNASFRGNLHGGYGGSYDSHPGSNWVGGFHWPAEVADENIEAMIEHFRSRGSGFTWFVAPFDEPKDLAERLERHGLILAGDQIAMARVGLEPDDIPINPAVELELVDGSSPESVEAVLQITGQGFNWTPDQIDERRPDFFERFTDPKDMQRRTVYLARLNGRPIGQAQVIYQPGIAYLGGASTLPEARNQRVYSTLLAQRLRDAHERGYHIAAIHAEPMSRRVVEKYRFKSYGRYLMYGWMPVPDPEVIRSLVPQD